MHNEIGFFGGFLTGAAGSMHCMGVCGGVASSLLLATEAGTTRRAAAIDMLALQLGRVAAYAALGAFAGAGGGAVAFLLSFDGTQQILRMLAATSIVLAGLSIVGLVPALGRRRAVINLRSRCAGRTGTLPLALGMAWGLAPCGMVYSALLTSAFAGSAQGGSVFMFGFGLATVPPMLVALFGTASLTSRCRTATGAAKVPLGWGMVVLGLLSVVEPARAIGGLCLGS